MQITMLHINSFIAPTAIKVGILCALIRFIELVVESVFASNKMALFDANASAATAVFHLISAAFFTVAYVYVLSVLKDCHWWHQSVQNCCNASDNEIGSCWLAWDSESYEFHTFCPNAQNALKQTNWRKIKSFIHKHSHRAKRYRNQITNSIANNYLRMNGATVVKRFRIFDKSIASESNRNSQSNTLHLHSSKRWQSFEMFAQRQHWLVSSSFNCIRILSLSLPLSFFRSFLIFEWLYVCVCVHPICFALKLFSIRYKVAKQFVSLISGILHLHFLAVASNLQSVWVGNQFVIFCLRWRRLWASLFFFPSKTLCVYRSWIKNVQDYIDERCADEGNSTINRKGAIKELNRKH